MLLAEEVFKKFAEEYKEKYGHLSEKELRSACESQFQLIKEHMESDVLEEVRLQYLFTVRPSRYRVIKQLKNSYKGYNRGNITNKSFNYYVKMMLEYIRKNPSKFIKYEEIIKETTGFTAKDIQEKKYQTYSKWYPDNGH